MSERRIVSCACGRDGGDAVFGCCHRCGQYWCGSQHCDVTQLVATTGGALCTRCATEHTLLLGDAIDTAKRPCCDACGHGLAQCSAEDTFACWGLQFHLWCLRDVVTAHVEALSAGRSDEEK